MKELLPAAGSINVLSADELRDSLPECCRRGALIRHSHTSSGFVVLPLTGHDERGNPTIAIYKIGPDGWQFQGVAFTTPHHWRAER